MLTPRVNSKELNKQRVGGETAGTTIQLRSLCGGPPEAGEKHSLDLYEAVTRQTEKVTNFLQYVFVSNRVGNDQNNSNSDHEKTQNCRKFIL